MATSTATPSATGLYFAHPSQYQDNDNANFPSENATLRPRSLDQDRVQNEPSNNSDNNKSSDEEKQKDGDEEQQDDDSEGPDNKTPVGFWSHRLNHVRKEAFGKWALTTVLLMAFILSVISIFYGVFNHIDSNLSSLVVYVVDFDGQAPYNTNTPIVGPTVVETMMKSTQMVPHLGFVNVPAANFQGDPMKVRQAVYDQQAWAAVIINANATSLLYGAVRNANVSYEPLGACQLVYIDSRDDTNWFDFIYPVLSPLLTEATTMVGETWARTILQEAQTDSNLLANMARVPQALSPAIGFSMYNLRPFYPYTIIPAITIGLIYLIIISFFSFSFYLPIHLKYLKPEGHPPLKFYQLILWRWTATVTAYLLLSLAYSLIALAFQINFGGDNSVSSQTMVTRISEGNPDAFGNATFLVYWMLNFVGMIALGIACENVAMVIGQPWTGLWLIFWVITNVSTAFYDIDIEPHFYYWGYAWPLHQIVEASRTILFDLSRHHLGLNFGILFAWAGVNSILFPICCFYMRWKSKHGVHEYYA